MLILYFIARLQAMLQVFSKGVVSEERKAWNLWIPHACSLVDCVQELLHCGGTIQTYNLERDGGR